MEILGPGELLLIIAARLGIPADELRPIMERPRLLEILLREARARDEALFLVAAQFFVELLHPKALREALSALDPSLAASTSSIAALALIEFLGRNRYSLRRDSDDALFAVVRAVEAGRLDANDVAGWLEVYAIRTR